MKKNAFLFLSSFFLFLLQTSVYKYQQMIPFVPFIKLSTVVINFGIIVLLVDSAVTDINLLPAQSIYL